MSKKSKKNRSKTAVQQAGAPVKKDDGQTLPSKEAGLFKQLVKYTETKQHKKALKTADVILKHYPTHGETLAMKALVQNGLKKYEEAETLVKEGIRYNLKSYVCWHVYGLIHRSHRRYTDAIKCYQMAVKFDPDNQSILRDLAGLLIQTRNLDDFQEARRKILMMKSNNRSNWLAYAVGSHLAGRHQLCLQVLDSYVGTQTEDQKLVSYENSELHLYKNQVLVEAGLTEQALAHLTEIESKVKDKQSHQETKASLLCELGRHSDAATVYRALLDTNPENVKYHMGLRKALRLDPTVPECRPTLSTDNPLSMSKWRTRNLSHSYIPLDQYTQEQLGSLCSLYEELRAQYPKCSAVKRLPLDFLSGTEFVQRAGEYIRPMIRRGIPSLFRDLKPLFRDPVKRDAVEALVTEYADELRSHGRFTADDEPGSEPPSCLLWALFYLGHHYDFVQNPVKALQVVQEAIDHTPTTIDLFVLKARIFKHAGDHQKAFEAMDHARSLDLADRYLNTKCVRYAWRNNMEAKAQELVTLFLRAEDGLLALYDMQVMWYALAAARSYDRQQNHAMALKHWDNIRRYYDQIREDQFDFHSYCFRKVTLRAYVDMLRFADRLHSHRYFFKAACLAVRVYLRLHDAPRTNTDDEEEDYTGLTPDEIKRRQKAAKRRQNKALAAERERKEQEKKEVVKRGRADEIDDDPYGRKLAETKTPLEDATKVIHELQKCAINEVETHTLAFEVFMRKKRYLLALQALKRGATLEQDHPVVHWQLVHYFHSLDSGAAQLHSDIQTVVDLERKSEICNGSLRDLSAFNEAFLSKHDASLPHRLAAARCILLLNRDSPSHRAQALGLVTRLDGVGVSATVCEEALLFVKTLDSSAEQRLAEQCRTKFPLHPAFVPQAEAD